LKAARTRRRIEKDKIQSTNYTRGRRGGGSMAGDTIASSKGKESFAFAVFVAVPEANPDGYPDRYPEDALKIP